ncbi:hypothetical protein FRC04_000040 [Tulasnella sp. 424]|nr:hypothetical protein FRC04_000040 [Tulasnella sp. 424]KAG8981903.1 hypothetical protein FRC05_000045 [Tulasnella sp. 425]
MLTRRSWTRTVNLAYGRYRMYSSKPSSALPKPTDELGMPLEPTWSVKNLLASYPAPTLETTTLKHIHKLSALTPPEEGTPEFETLRKDLAEMIRMVEAVKTIELPKDKSGIPDGRIWPEARGMQLEEGVSREALDLPEEAKGRSLLDAATNTKDGFYLVETERKPKGTNEDSPWVTNASADTQTQSPARQEMK